MFARAKARDQRLIRAKEKRESANRARIQKIEIDIQERNNRAVSSLKRQGKYFKAKRERVQSRIWKSTVD